MTDPMTPERLAEIRAASEAGSAEWADPITDARDLMAYLDDTLAYAATVQAERDMARRELAATQEALGPRKAGALASLVKHATRLVQIERDDARAEVDRLRAQVEAEGRRVAQLAMDHLRGSEGDVWEEGDCAGLWMAMVHGGDTDKAEDWAEAYRMERAALASDEASA